MPFERHLVVGDFMQRSGPGWGLVISSVLAAGVAAGCFVYLLSPPLAETHHSESSPRTPPLIVQDKEAAAGINPTRNDDQKSMEAFQRAADAILQRAANMGASVPVTNPQAGGKVPLPRRRPVSSP